MFLKFKVSQSLGAFQFGLILVLSSFLLSIEGHYELPKCIASSLDSFIPTSNQNPLCNYHANWYARNLEASVYWAVNLKDASASSINGLLAGDKFHLGHYDQCLDTNEPTTGLRGQYCLMTVQIDLEGLMRRRPTDLMQKLLASTKDPIMVRRDIFHVGVCVPSGCTHQDVEASFRAALARNALCAELGINVTMPVHQCAMTHGIQWNTSKVLFCSVLLSLGVVVIFSTVLEMNFLPKDEGVGKKSGDYQRTGTPTSLNYSKVERLSQTLVPFSLVHNFRALYHQDPANFAILNGTKVVCVLLLVLAHRILTLVYKEHPVHNMEQAERIFTKQSYAMHGIVLFGALLNDIFLSISGFLTAYSLFRSQGCRNGRQFVAYAWQKILKMYPAYLFTIAFTTVMLADMSDGPFWNMKILPIVKECQKNWWTNVLFLNTFVNESDMCIINSWYTATIVQLMICLTLAVYLSRQKPQVAKYFLLGSLVLFTVILFCIIYYKGHLPLFHFTITTMKNPADNIHFIQRYIKSYARAIPYVIGVLGAYLTIYLKRKQYQMSTKLGSFLFVIIFSSACFVNFAAFSLYLHKFSPLQNAFLGTSVTLLFSLLVTAMYMTHINCAGFGPFDSIIRSRFLTVLSRLSFWVHLLNVPFQQMMTASGRTSGLFCVTTKIWESCGDVIYLYVISFILYLVVEVPVLHLLIGKSKVTPKENHTNGHLKSNNHFIFMDDPSDRKND